MGESDILYVWPTPLRPHALVHLCPSVQSRGGFFASAEVVVFPKATGSSGYSVLPTEEYLENGADLDIDASAVRFNADTADKKEPFSLIWTPLTGDDQAKGCVHALARPWMTPIMELMIGASKTHQVDTQAVLRNAKTLSPLGVQAAPRYAIEAGLVKSRSIPGSNLRLVSRLSDELLREHGKVLHEVVMAAAVPEAVDDAKGLECEVTVFPETSVSIAGRRLESVGNQVTRRVAPKWRRPQDGRIGLGSRYVFEGLVTRNELIMTTPPAPGRPPSGRLAAEVLVRLLRNGEEVCRLHHPLGLEPPQTASPFAEAVQHILDAGMVRDVDVATAAGVPAETVRAWLRDAAKPSGDETERVNELSAIVDRLAAVVRADYIALWLRKPIPELDDDKPLDVLARGDYRLVSRLVAGLEAPVAS